MSDFFDVPTDYRIMIISLYVVSILILIIICLLLVFFMTFMNCLICFYKLQLTYIQYVSITQLFSLIP